MKNFASLGLMESFVGFGRKVFRFPQTGETHWLVGTAQDITSRKQAEMKISEQLHGGGGCRAEAEALRRSTLALSQNLAMDSVLDTLLQCISELVPFDRQRSYS